MKIPDKLKVGGHNIKVLRMISSDMSGDSGDFNKWTNTIRIATDADLPDSAKLESFLHEITEVINHQYNLNIEHIKIAVLSEVLYQVLKDNRLKFYEDMTMEEYAAQRETK